MFNFKKSIVAVMSVLAISVTGITTAASAKENVSDYSGDIENCQQIEDCDIDVADYSLQNEYSVASTYPFPYSEYKGGTYYTNDGNKCTDHGWINGVYVNPCEPGSGCNCKEFEWSIQCAGFAREIYSRYHGYSMDSATKNQINSSISTADEAKNLILGLPECTFIKVKTASGRDHFMIATRSGNNVVTLYHANYKSGCEITYERISFSEFVERFSYIYYTC